MTWAEETLLRAARNATGNGQNSDQHSDQNSGQNEAAPIKRFVYPGEVFASAKPTTVSTILGSCVAVCLWDPQLRIGGLNHFMLAYGAENGLGSGRFANVAIPRLITLLESEGSLRANLRAKVFGGACILRTGKSFGGNLGEKNINVAHRMLDRAGIPIIAESVGGDAGRKLIFHTDDGVALVRLFEGASHESC